MPSLVVINVPPLAYMVPKDPSLNRVKFFHSRTKKCVGSNKICPEKVYISVAEIAEKNNRTTSFGEESLFT